MSRSRPRIVLLRENLARGDRSAAAEVQELAKVLKTRNLKTRTLNAEMPPARLAKKLGEQTTDAVWILSMPNAFRDDRAARLAAWTESLGYPLIGASSRCRTLCAEPETARALLRGLGLPVASGEVSADGSAFSVALAEDPESLSISCPDWFDAAVQAEVERSSKAAYRGLGCRDYALVSWINDATGSRIAELDPSPSVAPGSPWRAAVERSGRDVDALLEAIVRRAIARGLGDRAG